MAAIACFGSERGCSACRVLHLHGLFLRLWRWHVHPAGASFVQFKGAPDDTQSSQKIGASQGGAVAAFDRVESAVEEAVERAATATKRTARRHFGRRTVATFGLFLKAIGIL